MKTIASLGEFGLLEALGLFRPLSGEGWLGPGDDCALFPAPRGQIAVTTDLLVEEVHFRLSTTPPRDLGYKSLAASISDLASMGAAPLACTVSLALPGLLPLSFAEEFYAGLRECSEKYSCALAGGDTSSSGKVFISVTAFGSVKTGKAFLRSGAKPGDDLWLSGATGESAGGFYCLEKGIAPAGPAKKLIERHLRPEPRLSLSLGLASEGLASSMIDVSDGVFIDAYHLAERSGAVIRIDQPSLPLTPELLEVRNLIGKDPFGLALGGGEDYELLFTAPRENREKIIITGENTGTAVTLIGEVEGTAKKGRVRLLSGDGLEIEPPRKGFEHFGG